MVRVRVVGFGVFSGMEMIKQRSAVLCFKIQELNMISLYQHMLVNANKSIINYFLHHTLNQ